MRFDASMESLINTGRSESFVDLNDTDLALSRSVLSQSREMLMSYQGEFWFFFFCLWWNRLVFIVPKLCRKWNLYFREKIPTFSMWHFDFFVKIIDFFVCLGHGYGAGNNLPDESVNGPNKQYGIGKIIFHCFHASNMTQFLSISLSFLFLFVTMLPTKKKIKTQKKNSWP